MLSSVLSYITSMEPCMNTRRFSAFYMFVVKVSFLVLKPQQNFKKMNESLAVNEILLINHENKMKKEQLYRVRGLRLCMLQ